MATVVALIGASLIGALLQLAYYPWVNGLFVVIWMIVYWVSKPTEQRRRKELGYDE